MSNKRVYLENIGCRLNQSEVAAMARQFQALGYTLVGQAENADLCVVNTCAVTNDASKTSRKTIRRLNQHNPQAEITVTGCYSQVAPQVVAALPGVQQIVDNLDKDRLVALVTGEKFDQEPIERHYRSPIEGMTRAFVKVQDGCDNQCTFCLTRLARGPGRSRPLEAVIREVQMLAISGYQEAVLTGVNLGAYGDDLGQNQGLYHLVAALLQATAIPRLRLSSLEPWDLTPDFFRLWENPRLCRHLHLPLQSGCDATLKRMRRRTSQSEFRALLHAARPPDALMAISTDLIVGFPGETAEEFAITRAFVEEMAFMKIHVFPYSVREGTPAAQMRGRIDPETVKNRVQIMQALSDQGEQRYASQHLNHIMPVLWEGVRGSSEKGYFHVGYTDNYLRIETTHPQVLTNQILPTRLEALSATGLWGSVITEAKGHFA